MRQSLSASLLLLVPSGSSLQVGLLCLGSVLLLFRGALVWLGSRCLLVFLWSSLAGVAFVRLFLLSSRPLLPSTGASWVLFPIAGFCPPSCCPGVHCLLGHLSLSLASVSFDLVFYSGASLLHSCPCPCLWVPSVRPPRPLLLVLLRLQPCVVLVHLLRNSVELQFLRDRVLTLGQVFSYGCFLGLFWSWSFLLFRIWSFVLSFFSLCSWLGSLSSASVRSFEVPLFISIPGAFRLPVWAHWVARDMR